MVNALRQLIFSNRSYDFRINYTPIFNYLSPFIRLPSLLIGPLGGNIEIAC